MIYIMNKKIKLLLLSILTPLLCIGASFGASPVPWTLVSSYSLGYNQCQNLWYNATLSNFYNTNDINNISFGCFIIYWPSGSIRWIQWPLNSPNYLINWNIHFNFWWPDVPIFLCGDSNYLISYLSTSIELDCNPLYSNYYVGFDLYDLWNLWGGSCSACEEELDFCQKEISSIWGELSSCSSDYVDLDLVYTTLSWNYNTCLNTLNSCNWQVWTLSWNLASCNSDLNSCLSNWSNCDTLYWVCVENLSGCNSDKASLQIYNESLSSQLNECLSSSWSIWSGSIFTFDFDLFRSDEWQDYSLPITNNLFLPNWYKAMLNSDHVLTIAKANSLNHAYSISDDEFSNKVISSYWTIFIFLMSLSFMLLFMFTIRKYFIWLKSVK